MNSLHAVNAKRVHVRQGFTEESIWRDALGGAEPLLVFVTYGPLDAPDHMPAGSLRSTNYGPHIATVQRAD